MTVIYVTGISAIFCENRIKEFNAIDFACKFKD